MVVPDEEEAFGVSVGAAFQLSAEDRESPVQHVVVVVDEAVELVLKEFVLQKQAVVG